MTVSQEELFREIGLSSNHINEFKRITSVKKIAKKERLIQEGTICNFIGIVLSGALRSYVRADDSEFNNDFYFENSFISAYTSFLTQQPTNCNIEALIDSEIAWLSHEHYLKLQQSDKDWVLLGKYISETFFIRKCKRETSFLRNSAATRLQSVLDLYPGIEQKVSQYHIASYLGIKPESLSRIKLTAR
jgi:CRP-like cAMP-binding protein